jgi:flagellar biogenesis protein FliO
MGKVALSLAVIIVLMLGLGFGYKKMQSLKLNGAWAMSQKKQVNVLSTHRVGKGLQILLVDVFDEVVVLGQGPTGLSFLYKLSDAKVRQLRDGDSGGERPDTGVHKSLSGLLGRSRRMAVSAAQEPVTQDEVLSESLEGLAATLEAQSLGSMALGAVEINGGAAGEGGSFDSFLERRLGKDRWRDDSESGVPTAKTASKLARAAQAAAATRPPAPIASQFSGGEDLDDVARSIRERARVLGRL